MHRYLYSLLIISMTTICGAEISPAQEIAPAIRSATQSPSPALRRPVHRTARHPLPATPPVVLVNNPVPDYMSGEVSIHVTGNQNPIIRLGLAPGGVTLVEFPAADRLFAIHPGDSSLVTVDESGIKSTDRFITIRPGSGFGIPSNANKTRRSIASIMVQMQSGMVMTFLFYPVPALSENAHRVVVMYSKEEVIAQRRVAGLAVNLDGKEQLSQGTNSTRIAATLPINERATQTALAAMPSPAMTPAEPRTKLIALPESIQVTAESGTVANRQASKAGSGDVVTAAQGGLREALQFPQQFTKWTTSKHGFSVSTSQVQEIGNHSRLLIIAVRNSSPATLQLLPGHPELLVQTYDEKSRPLEVSAIKKLHVESSAIRDAIPAGATVYYAVAYEAPILGAHQQLRIAVGQTNAADEPVAADITTASR